MWRWRLMSSHFQVGHGCVRTVLKSTYGKAVVKTKPTRAVLCCEGEAAPVYMEKSNALQWSLPPSHNRVTTSCSMAIKTPGPLVWELRVFFSESNHCRAVRRRSCHHLCTVYIHNMTLLTRGCCSKYPHYRYFPYFALPEVRVANIQVLDGFCQVIVGGNNADSEHDCRV